MLILIIILHLFSQISNKMKAINFNNDTYKINSERGDFYYTENNKGKVKCFSKNSVEVIEIDEMPKAKVYKKIEISGAAANRIKTQYEAKLNASLEAELGRKGSTEFLISIR